MSPEEGATCAMVYSLPYLSSSLKTFEIGKKNILHTLAVCAPYNLYIWWCKFFTRTQINVFNLFEPTPGYYLHEHKLVFSTCLNQHLDIIFQLIVLQYVNSYFGKSTNLGGFHQCLVHIASITTTCITYNASWPWALGIFLLTAVLVHWSRDMAHCMGWSH